MGVCKEKLKLKMYIIIQPIIIVLEIVISIVDFLGFNGFVRVHKAFTNGQGGAGVLGLLCSIIFLSMGIFSSFIYVKIWR
jgi:cytochrome c oxidase subunit IV